jgi:hypothetical protein
LVEEEEGRGGDGGRRDSRDQVRQDDRMKLAVGDMLYSAMM